MVRQVCVVVCLEGGDWEEGHAPCFTHPLVHSDHHAHVLRYIAPLCMRLTDNSDSDKWQCVENNVPECWPEMGICGMSARGVQGYRVQEDNCVVSAGAGECGSLATVRPARQVVHAPDLQQYF